MAAARLPACRPCWPEVLGRKRYWGAKRRGPCPLAACGATRSPRLALEHRPAAGTHARVTRVCWLRVRYAAQLRRFAVLKGEKWYSRAEQKLEEENNRLREQARRPPGCRPPGARPSPEFDPAGYMVARCPPAGAEAAAGESLLPRPCPCAHGRRCAPALRCTSPRLVSLASHRAVLRGAAWSRCLRWRQPRPRWSASTWRSETRPQT